VIGTIGLLLSTCGASGASYEMVLPRMLDWQREMVATMQKTEQARVGANDPESTVRGVEPIPSEMLGQIEHFMEVPEGLRPWFVVSGIVGLAAFSLLGFAALQILLRKPNGVRLLPWAAGATLAWAVFKIALALGSGAFVLVVTAPGAVANGVGAAVLALGAYYSDLRADLEPPRDG
jgi:hypothetical protein